MGLEHYDTTSIPTKISTAPQWMIAKNIYRSENNEDTAGYVLFPDVSLKDDSFTLTCPVPVPDQINTAEALAACQLRFKTPNTGALLLDWANAKSMDRVSRPILIDTESQTQRQQRWLSSYYEDYTRRQIKQNYLLIEEKELLVFFQKNTHLTNILGEVKEEIINIFGTHVKSLSLEHTMDMEEGFEGVTVLIHTSLPLEKSFFLLNEFDEKYWLNKDYNIRKYMSVMVAPE